TLPDGSHGSLVPRPVKRTFQNITRSIVNLRGLHVTPGHVFACGEGGFETIATILARDGTLIERDGRRIRARTGAPFGSPEDLPVDILYDDQAPTGPRIVTVRAGIPTGGETDAEGRTRFVSLVEMLARSGFVATPDGGFRNAAGESLSISDWLPYSTPFDTPIHCNWVITGPDRKPYTPGWIRELQADAAEELAGGDATRRITATLGSAVPRLH
ncbi:MAG: hypothetical protein O9325_10310, partial [Roseomonas sp.]|nr:hypothetical protein [Roseomonas sp.]